MSSSGTMFYMTQRIWQVEWCLFCTSVRNIAEWGEWMGLLASPIRIGLAGVLRNCDKRDADWSICLNRTVWVGAEHSS